MTQANHHRSPSVVPDLGDAPPESSDHNIPSNGWCHADDVDTCLGVSVSRQTDRLRALEQVLEIPGSPRRLPLAIQLDQRQHDIGKGPHRSPSGHMDGATNACRNYDHLAALVRDGRLSITYVHGTPRSGTTIVEKALGQSADVMLNEPFFTVVRHSGVHGAKENFRFSHWECACGLVLRACEPYLSGAARVRVVVKDVSGVMPPPYFRQWLRLVSGVLLTYRDPYSQFVSFARAWYEKSNGIKAPDPAPFIQQHLLEMESHRDISNLAIIEKNLSRWTSLHEELQALTDRAAEKMPFVAIETTLMRAYPFDAFDNMLDLGKGIWFAGRALLAQPWTTNPPRLLGPHHPFQERALASNGLDPLALSERFDPSTITAGQSRQHIESLIPIYRKILALRPNACLPGTSAELANRPCFRHEKLTLADLQPPAAILVSEHIKAREGRVNKAPTNAKGSDSTMEGMGRCNSGYGREIVPASRIKLLERAPDKSVVLESLLIRVTQTCNLRCEHCGAPPEMGRIDGDTIIRLVDEVPTLKRIKLSGGEPTLRMEEMKRVVKYAAAKGLFVQLNTNGTIMDRQDVDDFASAGLSAFHYSFNCLTPDEFHEQTKSPPELYRRLVENITYSASVGRVVLETAVHRRNVRSLREFNTRVAELGAHAHEIQPVMPSGRASWGMVVHPEDLTRELVHLLANRNKAIEVFLDCLYVNPCSPFAGELFSFRFEDGVTFVTCIDGWKQLYVMADGDIVVCNMGLMREALGNIFEDSIMDVFHRSEALDRFRRWNRGGCCANDPQWSSCRNMCQAINYVEGRNSPQEPAWMLFARKTTRLDDTEVATRPCFQHDKLTLADLQPAAAEN